MLVRKALLQDATNIYDLVNSLSGDGTLLKRVVCGDLRKRARLYRRRIRRRRVSGLRRAALLRPASVRGALDRREARSQGTRRGRTHSRRAIEEAEEHGIQSVCLFTRIPDFFFKYGFRTVEDKTELPDKIFKDCQICPRLHRCDEVAMVRGRIPRISILGPKIEAEQLVRISG